MSALHALLDDYQEHLKIPFHILTKESTKNSFKIIIYCKECDINIKKELEHLNDLFLCHSFTKMVFYPFEVKEIISLRRDYFSTYIFSSRKQ